MYYLRRFTHFIAVMVTLMGASMGRDFNENWTTSSSSFSNMKMNFPKMNLGLSESTPLFGSGNDDTSNIKNCLGCTGVTCTVITVGVISIAPFLAGFSYDNYNVALASFIYNGICAITSLSDCKNMCSLLPLISATVCAGLYWGMLYSEYFKNLLGAGSGYGLWAANTGLTAAAPVLMLFMLACGGAIFAGIKSKV